MRTALVVALLVLPVDLAFAQASLVGGPLSSDPPSGTAPVRWPDVAHDPTTDTWLVVSGAGNVAGLWLSGDGAAIGAPFVVQETAGIYAQAPRVAFAGAGFFVAWHESLAAGGTAIRARVIGRGGPLTGDFTVSPPGTNWEMGAALSCSVASGECLCAWQSTADTRIVAQRVAFDGTMRGGPIAVDSRAHYFRDPAVALHAATDTFFLGYAGCITDGDCFVAAQRIRAGTGELVAGPIELDASIEAGYVPELAYGAATREVLTVWHRLSAGASFEGRRIAGDGTLGPTTRVADVGSYDASSLGYSATSNTFLFVTHGTTAEDVAIELSALGTPLSAPLPFGPASATGNFNPRVAASGTRAEWMAVTSTEFARLTTQRFSTATRDPTGVGSDAGVAALDAATAVGIDAAGTDARVLDARVLDGGRARSTISGCGSCAARSGSPSPLFVLVLFGLACRAGAGSVRLRSAAAPVGRLPRPTREVGA